MLYVISETDGKLVVKVLRRGDSSKPSSVRVKSTSSDNPSKATGAIDDVIDNCVLSSIVTVL